MSAGAIPTFDDFKKQQAAPAIPSFEEFKAQQNQPVSSGPAMNPGHAPTFGDQAKESLDFLGNEVKGLGHALNPVTYANSVMTTGPVDMVKNLVHLPGQMVDQFKTGDMSGLAQNIGGLAAAPIAGKALAGIPKLASAVSDASASPVGVGMKAAGTAFLKNVPIVGKPITAAMDAYKAASEPPPPQTAPIPPVKYLPKPEAASETPLAPIPRVKFNPLPKPSKPLAPIPPVRYNPAPEPVPEPEPMAEVPPVKYNRFSKLIGQSQEPPAPKPAPIRTAPIPAVQWHPNGEPAPVSITARPPKPAALRTVRVKPLP